jgi:hypothetical protein
MADIEASSGKPKSMFYKNSYYGAQWFLDTINDRMSTNNGQENTWRTMETISKNRTPKNANNTGYGVFTLVLLRISCLWEMV